jgi:hypothetical protein
VRKWFVGAAVAALMLISLVPLALAGNGNGHSKGHGWGHGKFQLQGRVVSVDPSTSTLVVLVKAGSKQVKSYRGLELTLTISAGARISGAGLPLTLADVYPGAVVHVGGVIDSTDPLALIYSANKVIVQKQGVAPAPTPTDTPTPTDSPTPTDTPTPTDSPTAL